MMKYGGGEALQEHILLVFIGLGKVERGRASKIMIMSIMSFRCRPSVTMWFFVTAHLVLAYR